MINHPNLLGVSLSAAALIIIHVLNLDPDHGGYKDSFLDERNGHYYLAKDKLYHFFFSTILVLIFHYAIGMSARYALLLTLVDGGLYEVHQAYPITDDTGYGSWLDFIADFAGAFSVFIGMRIGK